MWNKLIFSQLVYEYFCEYFCNRPLEEVQKWADNKMEVLKWVLGVSSQDKENVSSAHLMKMGVLVAAMPERTYDPVGDDDCLKVDNFMPFLNSVIICFFSWFLHSTVLKCLNVEERQFTIRRGNGGASSSPPSSPSSWASSASSSSEPLHQSSAERWEQTSPNDPKQVQVSQSESKWVTARHHN